MSMSMHISVQSTDFGVGRGLLSPYLLRLLGTTVSVSSFTVVVGMLKSITCREDGVHPSFVNRVFKLVLCCCRAVNVIYI